MTSINAERAAARRPVILITPDLATRNEKDAEPHYVVRENYAAAVAEAGGLPLILPYGMPNIDAALRLADGVLITGTTPGYEATPARREFELELIRRTMALGKPLLGICNGMQLMGEWLGGTFVHGLPAKGRAAVDHMPSTIPDHIAHPITFEAGSLLATLGGEQEPAVNSLHRHMLTGEGQFRIAARAPDGVIEAIEGLSGTFCLGVQWHPEYRLTELDRAILHAFITQSASGPAQTAAPAQACAVRKRIAGLGLSLPAPSTPPGAFVGAIRNGDTVTVSGQVPLRDGAVLHTGHLGETVSLDEGRECAGLALLNALAQLETVAGGLERVKSFGRLAGYVAAAPDFTRHGAVIDGASELLRAIFPDRWAHARVALGVRSLPRGVPVEIELTAHLENEKG